LRSESSERVGPENPVFMLPVAVSSLPGWNPDGVRNSFFHTQGSPDPGNPGLWDVTPMASGEEAFAEEDLERDAPETDWSRMLQLREGGALRLSFRISDLSFEALVERDSEFRLFQSPCTLPAGWRRESGSRLHAVQGGLPLFLSNFRFRVSNLKSPPKAELRGIRVPIPSCSGPGRGRCGR
jgi:hypothetical protein